MPRAFKTAVTAVARLLRLYAKSASHSGRYLAMPDGKTVAFGQDALNLVASYAMYISVSRRVALQSFMQIYIVIRL